MEKGAVEVYACCTHAVVFSPSRAGDSAGQPLKEIVVTDSIHLSPEKLIPKLTVLSVAPSSQRPFDASDERPVSTLFD